MTASVPPLERSNLKFPPKPQAEFQGSPPRPAGGLRRPRGPAGPGGWTSTRRRGVGGYRDRCAIEVIHKGRSHPNLRSYLISGSGPAPPSRRQIARRNACWWRRACRHRGAPTRTLTQLPTYDRRQGPFDDQGSQPQPPRNGGHRTLRRAAMGRGQTLVRQPVESLGHTRSGVESLRGQRPV